VREGLVVCARRVYIRQHDADGLLTATRTAVPGVSRGGGARCIKSFKSSAANTFKKRTRACVYIYYIHKAITGV